MIDDDRCFRTKKCINCIGIRDSKHSDIYEYSMKKGNERSRQTIINCSFILIYFMFH